MLKDTVYVSALVIVGDRNGHVGFGTGKANSLDAIRKRSKTQRKTIHVPIIEQQFHTKLSVVMVRSVLLNQLVVPGYRWWIRALFRITDEDI